MIPNTKRHTDAAPEEEYRMKSPADTWNEAYGDVFPFDRVDSLA